MKTLVAAAVAAVLSIAPAMAQDVAAPGALSVELNDLQAGDAGCRAVFVINNGLGKPLDKVALRVVAFDTEQKAKLFLSIDAGTLPAGKTRVLRFDLGEGVGCETIGRLVLDDVTSCEGEGLDRAGCLAAVTLSSRAGVPFDL